MTHRFLIPVMVAVLALGGAAACGGKAEPEGPTPEELEQMRQDSIRAAEQDSILRAREQARRDSIAAMETRRMETAAAREIIEAPVYFDYDRSALTAQAEQSLMRKLAVLRANPDLAIRIAGHADERGSVEYNRALGQRRAEAAKDYLTRFGISPARITTVSFGEDRPAVQGSNESAWAQNRRDEFTIVTGGDQLRNPSGP